MSENTEKKVGKVINRAEGAIRNATAVTNSTWATSLRTWYDTFLEGYTALTDAVMADFKAETNGTSRADTTANIITAADDLAITSDQLKNSIANYADYMRRNGRTNDPLRKELVAYKFQFLYYATRLRELAGKAKSFNTDSDIYKHRKDRKSGTYENYRANAVALKSRATHNINSIDLNNFRNLLIKILPERLTANLHKEPNVPNVPIGKLFGNNNCSTNNERPKCTIQGGKRKTHKRRHSRKRHTRRR